MEASLLLAEHLKRKPVPIGKVVDLDADDRLYRMNLTLSNTELNPELLNDARAFSAWADKKLLDTGCRYGIGGYLENRTIYASRELFGNEAEPRSLHLGVDIWGPAGTPVYAPLSGTIHSFQDNANYGDYGPTIILEHDVSGLALYILYGHLSRENLSGLATGQVITANQQIGAFGNIEENGNWPPHLHFQLMLDMEGLRGDYPGVCRLSEKEKYLANIPDPALLLQFGTQAYR